jgi:heterodisulfide reductase subunit C
MNVPLMSEMLTTFRDQHSGHRLDSCIQCGTCSGSCPLATEMDFGPRGLFALIRAGDLESALRSNTLWLCVSCQACTVRCPQEIPVTDLMYALKRMALTGGFVPRDQKIPDLYQAFVKQVQAKGRASETMIGIRYGLRHPGDMLSQLPLAWELLKRKRITM